MRIGASISGFERQLLNAVAEANSAAAANALRISTGKKINSPADDPSGFLRVSKMEGRLDLVQRALTRVDVASNIASGLQTNATAIRTQLTAIRTALLEDEDLSLTSSQRDENQAEIDAAIDQINSLASAEIVGERRLDGSGDFTVSGVNSAEVESLEVFGVGGETSITGHVVTRAAQSQLTHTGSSGQVANTATFTLQGETGSTSISVTAAEDLTDVATRINQSSHKTGVTASASGDVLTFESVGYGEDATIGVTLTSGGPFAVAGGNGDGTAEGVDAVAVINGATLTGDGNKLYYSQAGLSFRLELAGDFGSELDTITISQEAVERFNLSTEVGRTTTLALPGLQAAQLGGVSGSLDQLYNGGSLSGLNTNTSQAIRVVDEALGKLTRVEGRIDGFANSSVASSKGLLEGFEDSLETALSNINSVDTTEENLLLSANSGLAQNAIASLAILDQQRSDILAIVKQIAGLV